MEENANSESEIRRHEKMRWECRHGPYPGISGDQNRLNNRTPLPLLTRNAIPPIGSAAAILTTAQFQTRFVVFDVDGP